MTGGNPFYVTEVLAAGSASCPRRSARRCAARAARLPPRRTCGPRRRARSCRAGSSAGCSRRSSTAMPPMCRGSGQCLERGLLVSAAPRHGRVPSRAGSAGGPRRARRRTSAEPATAGRWPPCAAPAGRRRRRPARVPRRRGRRCRRHRSSSRRPPVGRPRRPAPTVRRSCSSRPRCAHADQLSPAEQAGLLFDLGRELVPHRPRRIDGVEVLHEAARSQPGDGRRGPGGRHRSVETARAASTLGRRRERRRTCCTRPPLPQLAARRSPRRSSSSCAARS